MTSEKTSSGDRRRHARLPQVNPPTTPEQFHAAIARNHPRLYRAHADLYDAPPIASRALISAIVGNAAPRAGENSSSRACPKCWSLVNHAVTIAPLSVGDHRTGVCQNNGV